MLIVLYATAGTLLAFATRGAVQGWVAFATGSLLVLTLGASWPVHRRFPIAGMALGALLASTFASVVTAEAVATDSYVIDYSVWQYVIWWIMISSRLFGAWTAVLLSGAGVTWLARRTFARPEPLQA